MKVPHLKPKRVGTADAHLGDLLLGDGEPDLASPRIQLLNSEMLLLDHGQWSIVGKLCENFGDVGMSVVQQVPLAPFLLFLHLFQFGCKAADATIDDRVRNAPCFRFVVIDIPFSFFSSLIFFFFGPRRWRCCS